MPKNLVINSDYFMLQTVLRNLINNSIKFTNTNGVISISANSKNGFIKILISDTGIGISKENLKKLFKLETSFTTAGTNSEKGTGLGLIVCKDFIEKNNGTIKVRSKVGKGTQFLIKIRQI